MEKLLIGNPECLIKAEILPKTKVSKQAFVTSLVKGKHQYNALRIN
jgi:hypothetical protein